MIINHNINALNTHRNLGLNNTAAGKNMEKLSSGLRINRAADDAAGLAISEKMRAQIRGLEQAQRNTQDGISFVQTAEGALNEVSAMLVRMKEIRVQAENDTYADSDKENIDAEVKELAQQINNIVTDTTFNGINITSAITIATDDVGGSISLAGFTFSISETADRATISGAIATLANERGTLGAKQNRLEYTSNNLGTTVENLTAAESRIRDTDMAKEMVNLTKNNILLQAAQSMLAQANSQPQGVLSLLR